MVRGTKLNGKDYQIVVPPLLNTERPDCPGLCHQGIWEESSKFDKAIPACNFPCTL